MQDIGQFRVLCLLVSLANDSDKSILANDLLNDCYSYYANCLTREQKREILKVGYMLVNNKITNPNHLIGKLDIFKKANCNRESLKEILHILEINY